MPLPLSTSRLPTLLATLRPDGLWLAIAAALVLLVSLTSTRLARQAADAGIGADAAVCGPGYALRGAVPGDEVCVVRMSGERVERENAAATATGRGPLRTGPDAVPASPLRLDDTRLAARGPVPAR